MYKKNKNKIYFWRLIHWVVIQLLSLTILIFNVSIKFKKQSSLTTKII